MPLELFNVGEPIADTKAPTDVEIGERWSDRDASAGAWSTRPTAAR